MACRDRDPQAGFTLLELLVALMVLALITALSGIFVRQLGAVTDLEYATRTGREVSAAIRHIERTLSEARELVLDPVEGKGAVFVGTLDSMMFIAAGQGGFVGRALSDVRISAISREDHIDLVQEVRKRPAMGDGWTRYTIAEGLGSVRFDYADREGSFVPLWSAGQLPSVVRIVVTKPAGRRIATERRTIALR